MIHFVINGKAVPAGSKRGFVVGGRVVLTDANRDARPWKALVADAALHVHRGPLLEGPLSISILEYRVRPKGHYGKKGLNKKGRETPYPTPKPDCLKIARGIEDALSGVVYRDDSQIVTETIRKRWGDKEQTHVWIREVSAEASPGGDGNGASAGKDGALRSDADQRSEGSDRGRVPHLGRA